MTMADDERAALRRIAAYLDAWGGLDLVLDDETEAASERFAATLAAFAAARDAVSPEDVVTFRLYVDRIAPMTRDERAAVDLDALKAELAAAGFGVETLAGQFVQAVIAVTPERIKTVVRVHASGRCDIDGVAVYPSGTERYMAATMTPDAFRALAVIARRLGCAAPSPDRAALVGALIAAARAIRSQADIRFDDDGAKAIDSTLLDDLTEAVEAIEAIERGSRPVPPAAPSPDRAAQVERIAEAIDNADHARQGDEFWRYNRWDQLTELTALQKDPYRKMALAAVLAAGWGPLPGPITDRERSSLVRAGWHAAYEERVDAQTAQRIVDAALAALPERHRRLVLEPCDRIAGAEANDDE